MTAPNTREWIARENAHKPSGLHIIVGGQVEVSGSGMEPVLTESAERNPQQLGLTLTIVDSGHPGTDALVWKHAGFHKVVNANDYETVAIRWEHEAIAHIEVLNDREHGTAMDKEMKAENAQAAKTLNLAPAKPAAAKPAPAKPAPSKPAAPAAAKPSPKKPTEPSPWKKPAPKKAAKKKAAAKKAPKAVGGWAKKAKKAKKTAKKTKKAARKAAPKSALKRLVKKLVKKFTPAKKKKKAKGKKR